jgi:transposase
MKGTSPSRVSRKAATGHKVPRWEVRTLINSLGRGSPRLSYSSASISPRTCLRCTGLTPPGKPERVRPSVPRAKLHEMIAALPPCTIGMEACSGAHHWARLFQALGHTVKLMAPKFVAPYRLSGKRGRGMSRQERPPSTASVACSVRWASCCR